MNVYLFLTAAIVLDALVQVLFRLLSKDEKGELASFSFQIFAALFFLPFVKEVPHVSSIWIYPLLSGILYGISGILLLSAYSIGRVSLLAPLKHLSPILVFVLAVFLLGESIALIKVVAIFLVFLGLVYLKKKDNILLSLKALLKDKACQFYFLFLLFFSLARTIDKTATLHFQTVTYSFLEYFFPSIIAFLFITFKREIKELVEFLSRKFVLASLVGLMVAARYAFFLKAISLVELSIVSSIVSLSTLVSLVMSRIFLKEKIESRWLAAGMMAAGSAILAYRI